MTPLLEIRNLQVSFSAGLFHGSQRIFALRGVDLSVASGETLGLVGESGCGKTTLARCAMGLLEPDAGSVSFDGCDLLRLTPAELRSRRRQFQMVFQDSAASLDPRMTLRGILNEPFEILGSVKDIDRDTRVSQLLEEVGLHSSLLDSRPGELSGGQQQRVAIARALALSPRLLIADEPVSALDASVQAQILNLLADLRERLGLTLILISHSLPVIAYLCSRVAIMYLGRIVEEAPAQEFFRAPLHPYSQALLASMPLIAPDQNHTRAPLSGEVPSPVTPPSDVHFTRDVPRRLPAAEMSAPGWSSNPSPG